MNSHFNILGTVAEPLNLQTSAKGTHWANLILTIERRYKDKDGTWKEDADTVSLPVFGKRAEWLAKSASEGDRIFATGRIGGESREHSGRTYYDTKLWVDDVNPLGPLQSAQRASIEKPGKQVSRDHQPQQPVQAIPAKEDDDADIPF